MVRAPKPGRHRVWVLAGSAVAGLAGAVPAYDFGARIGGSLFGWVTGLNGGLICALLAGAALERLFRRR
ncbi:MAG: hypothetical protein Fur0014_14740 [Rubrivivax sp.]